MQRTEFPSSLPSDFNDKSDDEFVIGVLSAPPGGGKSTALLNEVASEPGLYVIAAPRIDLIEEQAERLRGLVEHMDPLTRPTITVVHSEQAVKGDVDRRLRDAIDDNTAPHAVVITTHIALMALAPGDVDGCHVRIDETPETGVLSGVVGLGASWPTMAARYDLVPGPQAGWSRLVPRRGVETLGVKQVRADAGAGLVDVHRLTRSRGRNLEVDLATWEDAGVTGRPPVQWRSIWSLAALRGCASLRIAAAGYDRSLIGHATACAGGVRVEVITVGQPRAGQPVIRIHYYTRHTGSTAWWKEQEGGLCLYAIARHLERIRLKGYFASNTATRGFFLGLLAGAEQVSPRNAGTNNLRHHTACAIIYSCKATDADGALIAALGLDKNAIRTAREDEDIFQTVTRGAIRDPAYAGGYDAHVYDAGQAERLRDRLAAAGYTKITLVPEDEVGILDVVRPVGRGQKGAPVAVETAAERKSRLRAAEAERGKQRRAADKAEKVAAGTYKPRGRPPVQHRA